MRQGHSKRLASIAVLIEGPASAVLLAEHFESIVPGGILDPISCTRPQPLGLVLSADSGVRLVATGSKVGALQQETHAARSAAVVPQMQIECTTAGNNLHPFWKPGNILGS